MVSPPPGMGYGMAPPPGMGPDGDGFVEVGKGRRPGGPSRGGAMPGQGMAPRPVYGANDMFGGRSGSGMGSGPRSPPQPPKAGGFFDTFSTGLYDQPNNVAFNVASYADKSY